MLSIGEAERIIEGLSYVDGPKEQTLAEIQKELANAQQQYLKTDKDDGYDSALKDERREESNALAPRARKGNPRVE